jgi:hypothetical protein
MQTLAGMMLGATIDPSILINQSTKEIPYWLFTGYGGRYPLDKPFGSGEHTYATDARILIRHADNPASGDPTVKLPNVGGLWWDVFDHGGWRTLGKPCLEVATTSNFSTALCPECVGTGREGAGVTKCQQCNADSDNWGVFTIDRKPVWGCPKCLFGYHGGRVCSACFPGWRDSVLVDGGHCMGILLSSSIPYYDPADRVGYVNGYETPCIEKLGHERFGADMTNRIRRLGEVEWRLVHNDRIHNDTETVLAFRFDAGKYGEGQGFLMPLIKS